MLESIRRAAARRASVVLALSLLSAASACAKKEHQVQARVTVDPHPSNCVFGVSLNVEGVPELNLSRISAPQWTSAVALAPAGKAAAITAGIANGEGGPDPKCDVPVGCELLVDGAVVDKHQAAQHVTCSTLLGR